MREIWCPQKVISCEGKRCVRDNSENQALLGYFAGMEIVGKATHPRIVY